MSTPTPTTTPKCALCRQPSTGDPALSTRIPESPEPVPVYLCVDCRATIESGKPGCENMRIVAERRAHQAARAELERAHARAALAVRPPPARVRRRRPEDGAVLLGPGTGCAMCGHVVTAFEGYFQSPVHPGRLFRYEVCERDARLLQGSQGRALAEQVRALLMKLQEQADRHVTELRDVWEDAPAAAEGGG